ncbi:MAG TPA: cupredoxin domain-containing protein [Symbiobacteriaceae bacterium]|nr:cupredoxin domain-containing protein [Symbiobacteriaceae bacterium]
MKKTLMLGLVAVLSLGALTACGGSSGGSTPVTIEMGKDGEMAFNPPQFTAKKGEKVTVKLVNKDSQAHSFVIADFNVKSGNVAANQTKEVTFTASKTGEIEFHCDVAGHKDGGMEGVLKVN